MIVDKQFVVAAGSTIGRDHRAIPRNCQDAYDIASGSGCTVGVVTDGCGSGAYSEVGARIGARLVARAVKAEYETVGAIQELRWPRIQRMVLRTLEDLADEMDDNLAKVVNDYFLFTILGQVMDGTEMTVFALGDGIVMVNDEQTVLGPFPGNQPPYLGYALIGSSLQDTDPESLQIRPVVTCPREELDFSLIGTDGVHDLMKAEGLPKPGLSERVEPIREFATDRCFTNPVLLSRRLNLVGRDQYRSDPETGRQVLEAGLLPDDTTMIVGRRFPETL